MKIVDLNVLLYAVNRDAERHMRLKEWWERALSGDEPVGLSWGVLLGFIRLATLEGIFAKPLSVEETIERVDMWLSNPVTRIVQETDEHWRIERALLLESGASGNLTTDAHLASLAIAHGATLVSCDADFGRFAGLRWENPAAK